jgi:hypothetical protein
MYIYCRTNYKMILHYNIDNLLPLKVFHHIRQSEKLAKSLTKTSTETEDFTKMNEICKTILCDSPFHQIYSRDHECLEFILSFQYLISSHLIKHLDLLPTQQYIRIGKLYAVLFTFAV